jgi:hypothetical protein
MNAWWSVLRANSVRGRPDSRMIPVAATGRPAPRRGRQSRAGTKGARRPEERLHRRMRWWDTAAAWWRGTCDLFRGTSGDTRAWHVLKK